MKEKKAFDGKYLPLSITIGLFLFMYAIGSILYPAFFSSQVFFNLFIDNAFLGIAAGIYLAHYTRFGRTIYAIGGSEQSALLMGLPVAKAKILVYTISGLCSAIAGVVFTFYMQSGYALHCKDTHLDAIAAAVIGGTLLTDGVGYIFGSVFGTLILGVIQTIINFQGTLSSWWTKIFIGVLIFLFIFIQTVISGSGRGTGTGRRPGQTQEG